MLQDLPTIFGWYFAIFLVGIIFLPLTRKIFSHFFDQGYAFSKILGILLTSYIVWLLASLKIAPFSQMTILAVLMGWFIVNLVIKFKAQSSNVKSSSKFKIRKRSLRIWIWDLICHLDFGFWIFEEALFLLALLFWSWVRGHEPSIHGLEKFMDFGFINSILNSKFFPPPDMWLAQASDPRYTQGFFINYYYYGHYVTAFLTKLTGILPEITYNLMLSTIFGLCFSASFSIGANLINFLEKYKSRSAKVTKFASEWLSESRRTSGRVHERVNFRYRALIGGLLTALLVTIAGNLHTIYLFTSGYPNENPVPFWQILKLGWNVSYWYPNATRFIPNTIHEFPSYSWIVADLHGHVLDIPFVLLTIALLLAFITKSQIRSTKSETNSNSQNSNFLNNFKIKKLINCFGYSNFEFRILPLLGLLTAVMYMTNAWDGIIYLGLSGLVILATQLFIVCQSDQVPKTQISNIKDQISKQIQNSNQFKFGIWYSFVIWILVFGFFILFSLPFNKNFQPFVHGIGVVGGWEMANALKLIKPLTNIAPGVETVASNLPKVVKFGPFLLEQGNNLRSPLWMLAVLWGFFYFNVILFTVYLLKRIKTQISKLKDQNYNLKFKNFKCKFESRLAVGQVCILHFKLNPIELFLLLLILLSTALLIFPEFFYMKDIYPGHYRANTMFKLGYQAFIMLSIVSGYVIIQFKDQRSKIKNKIQNIKIFKFSSIVLIFDLLFLILVLIYPYFGLQSYYGVFSQYPRKYEGQDGLQWLKNSHPGDYDVILWLRNNVLNPSPYPLPTILEAVGDSYTDYGRISANSGLPTVLGWPVHEWLWRGSYDEAGKRVEEVRQIYEAGNEEIALSLLKKYNVRYAIVADLEREKYANLKEDFFLKNGELVFSSNGTKIYSLP